MYKCVDCETVFKYPQTWEEERGEFWGAEEMKAYSERRYKKCLCAECMKKAENERK